MEERVISLIKITIILVSLLVEIIIIVTSCCDDDKKSTFDNNPVRVERQLTKDPTPANASIRWGSSF